YRKAPMTTALPSYTTSRDVTFANKIGPTVVGCVDGGRQSFTSHLQIPAWNDLGIDPIGLAEEAPSPDHKGPIQFTMRMGARLQGFPDDWEFEGAKPSIKRQIANALPPVMARAIGLAIYSALAHVEFDYNKALRRPLLGTHPGPLATVRIQSRGSPQLEDVW
ncbi:hypothetical protein EJC49_23055, partial [Aquibium carbonis]